MAGPFVTFEGIDGCGKSTQAGLLADRLRRSGHPVLLTREPGATELGRLMRDALLESSAAVSDTAELLLFAADRAQHVEEVIRPALARGEVVISDRFADSTRAYQGGGRGMDDERIEASIAFATRGLVPDLTIWIDVELSLARARRETGRRDRLEREEDAFFDRVRKRFSALADSAPDRIVRVDGSGGTDDVADLVASVVTSRLPLQPTA